MKHLKQFESFHKGVRDLSWQEWDHVMSLHDDKFTEREKEEIYQVIAKAHQITGMNISNNLGSRGQMEYQIRQYKQAPDWPDVLINHIEISKKIKGDDPEWFYIHVENYENATGDYFECESFEDFLEKLEEILLET